MTDRRPHCSGGDVASTPCTSMNASACHDPMLCTCTGALCIIIKTLSLALGRGTSSLVTSPPLGALKYIGPEQWPPRSRLCGPPCVAWGGSCTARHATRGGTRPARPGTRPAQGRAPLPHLRPSTARTRRTGRLSGRPFYLHYYCLQRRLA